MSGDADQVQVVAIQAHYCPSTHGRIPTAAAIVDSDAVTTCKQQQSSTGSKPSDAEIYYDIRCTIASSTDVVDSTTVGQCNVDNNNLDSDLGSANDLGRVAVYTAEQAEFGTLTQNNPADDDYISLFNEYHDYIITEKLPERIIGSREDIRGETIPETKFVPRLCRILQCCWMGCVFEWFLADIWINIGRRTHTSEGDIISITVV